MDVVTTSLEALIQRVTNPQNQKPDVAASEAFCVMVTKEPEGIQIGSKLLALHIQSSNESEALQALALLDMCMRRCGSSFHAEIGKFRFLNEMIRLVSPKYLGGKTPVMVRHKVLQLLYTWTKEYPRELKIKEAYEMLKKQGVIEDDSLCTINASEDASKASKTKHTIFYDEEKSNLLQKLLQSKDPDDLLCANRLIKTMVREDERRVQLNSRRIMELESVHNNAKLLSEMLDSYNWKETSKEDLELMKELKQACERLKPIVLRLANETQDNEEMLGDVLAASDELGQVFEKYSAVIDRGESLSPKTDSDVSSYLLDLSSPLENNSIESSETHKAYDAATTNQRSDMEVLGDIFNSLGRSENPEIPSVSTANLLIPNSMIMQPISVQLTTKKGDTVDTPEEKLDSKSRALEELNELGETLLKQSLSSSISNIRSNSTSKETVNNSVHTELASKHSNSPSLSANGSYFANTLDTLNATKDKSVSACTNHIASVNETETRDNTSVAPTTEDTLCKELEIKPLSDINVSLDEIKPGINPPITVLEEKNGITVVLNFARDNPRQDVFIVVITTMSKNLKPLSNYLFQAVVPKKCKCRLQPPSGTELPGHNPFLPPSAITQIMLIANPSKESVSLKFMLSYTMDDETFTEMGEVEKLPLL
ncbi:ADP-ribosylation factor-binding protein Gga isoform X2 [Lasioglossum baleicum]|uniref:ADP-ribosylation factor-binding protein Gga isoform X2 n=1 Tax=Lasioglossum baleicum TaxID=434251 RepID=UPI003FCD99F9